MGVGASIGVGVGVGAKAALSIRGTLQTKGNKGMIVEQDRLIKTNP